MNSIHGRLIALAGLLLLAVSILVPLVGLLVMLKTDDEWMSENLSNDARLIASLWSQGGGCAQASVPINFELIDADIYEFSGVSYIAICDGKIRTKSEMAPDLDLSKIDTEYTYLKDLKYDEEVLVLGRKVERGMIVTVAHISAPMQIDYGVLTRNLWPLYVALMLMVSGLFFGIRSALRPLNHFSEELSRRNDQDLSPMSATNKPREVQPVITSLNQLFSKLTADRVQGDAVLVAERRFTANAAHELLTPLAAIKAEVQLQHRMAADDELRAVFSEIDTRVDRASHTVDQLLTLARLDPASAPLARERVDVAAELRIAAGQYANRIESKKLDFQLDAPPELILNGISSAVSVLARNLFDNATKFAPAGGRVRASLTKRESTVEILITNDTNHLPEYLIEHMFERFVRGANTNEAGAGLGMSIIKRAVELHDGEVRVTPDRAAGTLSVLVNLSLN